MLIEFNVANYASFKDRATLSMVASKDRDLEENNVFKVGKRRLLKSVVIYGANASGKSNLLDAMAFMRHMVSKSSKDTTAAENINVRSFKLSTECVDKPSFFEIVFIQNKTIYRYGFTLDRKKIHSEWLFNVPTTKEARLFVREGKKFKLNTDRFKEGRGLQKKTRENALFLSVCAQWNGKISMGILSWFQNLGLLHGLHDFGYLDETKKSLEEPEKKKWIMQMINIADFLIEDIETSKKKLTIEDLPELIKDDFKRKILDQNEMLVELKTVHSQYGKNDEEVGKILFDLEDDESGGTQKFVTMAGPLLNTIQQGKVIVIDELDSRLHPKLTWTIVELFNSYANKKNAQLIFASHDTSLLNNKLFRRDQIWFTEKEKHGSTELYSLIELKGVRKESSFSKDYILGKYGAIPFIGDSKWLFCED